MTFTEEAFTFSCAGSQLVGILHRSARACRYGVLVVVGGPQYRAGSHRQFILLARNLAAEGIPVMRFDYRGMGDSEGEARSFDDIGEDIQAAIQEFLGRVGGIESVIIWGLCDAASAALFYAPGDSRVGGLVLLNPWVRTDSGEAKAYIKNYYARRLFSRELWRKVFRGAFDFRSSLASLSGLIRKAFHKDVTIAGESCNSDIASLPVRMCNSLEKFGGPVLVILSGNQDYVADEFRDLVNSSRKWKKLMQRGTVTSRDLAEANHTFSRAEWRGQVECWTAEWVKDLEGPTHR